MPDSPRPGLQAPGPDVAPPSCLLQVLDTYMFHSFLKARLNRTMDAFAQMDLDTQSEEDRCLIPALDTAPWGSEC